MKEHEVRLTRDVARAAAAWLNAPVDHEAYRRLVAATQAWNEFCAPRLESPEAGEEELLDGLGEASPPRSLSEGVEELRQRLHLSRGREESGCRDD